MIKRFIALIIFFFFMLPLPVSAAETFFEVQSIDTMKLSRDKAREVLRQKDFDNEIDTEMKYIAATGATHVAIDTPYDDEFIPVLKRWVKFARKHKLKVWFRGNFAGWERWFNYPALDRKTHMAKTKRFITEYQDIFEDGDIFVSCPECENGGPGDPRETKDVKGFRTFIIEEYTMVKNLFESMDLDVKANYYSMNGDVASLIMDKDTTQKLDGIMAIDHYVDTPEQTVHDAAQYAQKSGGSIVLGEWGAPIPDIHGEMTDQEQSDWIEDLLQRAIKEKSIVALNYWTNKEGSTAIFHGDNSPKLAVLTLSKYFRPQVVKGTVKDSKGNLLDDVVIKSKYRETISDNGQFSIPILGDEYITFEGRGYFTSKYQPKLKTKIEIVDIKLNKMERPFWMDIWDRLQTFIDPTRSHTPVIVNK